MSQDTAARMLANVHQYATELIARDCSSVEELADALLSREYQVISLDLLRVSLASDAFHHLTMLLQDRDPEVRLRITTAPDRPARLIMARCGGDLAFLKSVRMHQEIFA